MTLSIKPELMRLIEERVKSGKYASAEDVVAAALVSLKQQEELDDFEAGEEGAKKPGGIIGTGQFCSGIPDLASNKKYLEGFGKS